MTVETVDPWQAALDAKEAPQIIYGEVMFDMYSCVLEKGTGKQPFDSTQHAAGQRRTAVKVGVYPLIEMGLTFSTEREFIAENGNDGWLKVTLPSLKALNVPDLRKLNHGYAKVEMIAYGSYVKKGTTETRSLTAPKFLQIYPDQAACLAAYTQESGMGTPHTPEATGLPLDDINAQLWGDPTSKQNGTNGHTNGTHDAGRDVRRKMALSFLPAMVKSCHHANPNDGIDLAKLEATLKANAILAEFFTLESPEVAEAVTAAVTEPAF